MSGIDPLVHYAVNSEFLILNSELSLVFHGDAFLQNVSEGRIGGILVFGISCIQINDICRIQGIDACIVSAEDFCLPFDQVLNRVVNLLLCTLRCD